MHLRVRRVVVHAGYVSQPLTNDIALVEVEDAMDFNENIAAVALPTFDAPEVATDCFLSGWGSISSKDGT